MPATFFSGGKDGAGGALFVTFNSKDQSVFYRVIKQTGWNEQTSKPSFAGGAVINVKLSLDEVGEFIHAISGHDACKFYHSFNKEVTTGNFAYYEKEFNGKTGPVKTRGFGFSVKKGELAARIGFSLGAAERLSQYLQFVLDHIHSAIYVQDKKEFEEYLKKKEGNKPKSVVKPREVVETPEIENVETNPPEIVVEGAEDSISW